nr:protection of telomeres protein 1B-like isoform X1 [Ipomoea batatas]
MGGLSVGSLSLADLDLATSTWAASALRISLLVELRVNSGTLQKSKRAKMARSHDGHKFLQITDAMVSINQRVNLIGVVTESGLPKQSRGTDCFVTMRIIDESQPKHGIAVNFFTEKMDMLPQLATEGDIIQLSHVVVLLFYTLLNF